MKKKMSKKLRSCRAEFANDAPFAAAIGACMLTSLLLPVTDGDGTEDSDNNDSAFGLSDARFSVMGIISFIPYFNWLVIPKFLFIYLFSHFDYIYACLKIGKC